METWTDETGKVRRVPTTYRRMQFGKFPGHAALRAYVFRRDQYTCRLCDRRASRLLHYDGRTAPFADDGTQLNLDHRLCLRHGGTNHPDNLQVLCETCNVRKVTTHDRHGRAG